MQPRITKFGRKIVSRSPNCFNFSFISAHEEEPLRVLVTGGSNGIGRAITELFAVRGNNVLSIDKDDKANQSLTSKYPNVTTFTCDILQQDAPEQCIDYMRKQWNGIDILINNANEYDTSGILTHELTEEQWNKSINIGLTSYFRFSKYTINQILKQPKLDNIYNSKYCIVNMCSTQAGQSQPGVSAYGASKGGILTLTKTMAVEYAPLIRINSISPGTISTKMVEEHCKLFDINVKDLEYLFPQKRLGKPMEIAYLTYFLCSEYSRFITGQDIIADGGMMALGGWASRENRFSDYNNNNNNNMDSLNGLNGLNELNGVMEERIDTKIMGDN